MTKIKYGKPSKTAQKQLDKMPSLQEWKEKHPGQSEELYYQTIEALQEAAKGSPKSITYTNQKGNGRP